MSFIGFDDNRIELVDELKWLEYDIDIANNAEAKYVMNNEIDELNALSKLPIEDIIDENYFLIDNTINDTWSIRSDSTSNESMHSRFESISTNSVLMQNEIFPNISKLKEVL